VPEKKRSRRGREATEDLFYHQDAEDTEFRDSENFKEFRNSVPSVPSVVNNFLRSPSLLRALSSSEEI
jgi:hypothetical protein